MLAFARVVIEKLQFKDLRIRAKISQEIAGLTILSLSFRKHIKQESKVTQQAVFIQAA